jgi:hypothetical protein
MYSCKESGNNQTSHSQSFGSSNGLQKRINEYLDNRQKYPAELVIPIEMAGTNSAGRPFSESGQMPIVSRSGAVIVSNYPLATDQELTIRTVDTNKEAEVRVVGLIRRHGSESVYGVILLDPNMKPWDVELPSRTIAETATAQVSLQCGLCQHCEVVQLNEIERLVFATNNSIERFCGPCSSTTVWKKGSKEAHRDSVPHIEEGMLQNKSLPAKSHNRRKHDRVRVSMSACIRQQDLSEEIVRIDDSSRGGFCFKSRNRYCEGSRIEVALPHSDAANIFVSAQIVQVQQTGNMFIVRVRYVKGSQRVIFGVLR